MDRCKYNLRHLWYIVSYILSRISNELACNAGVFWRASAFDQASAILNSHSEDRGLWRDEKASKGKKNNGGGMEEKLRLSVVIQFEIIWQRVPINQFSNYILDHLLITVRLNPSIEAGCDIYQLRDI